MVLMLAPSEIVAKKKKTVETIVKEYLPDRIPEKASADKHLSSTSKPKRFRSSNSTRNIGNGMQGIDVSHYQGTINWSVVAKNKDVGFLYVKATEGQSYVDDKYIANIKGAKQYGIKVGSYHFFRPTVDPEIQYNHFLSVMKVSDQDLLPLIDVETISGASSINSFRQKLLLFCRLVAHAFNGQKPIIYTGKNFYDKYFAYNSDFSQYKFMIASYIGDEPILADNADYLIWQYTGKGTINGIKGHVDRSCFIGDHNINEILVKPW